jgi:magnesium transporter
MPHRRSRDRPPVHGARRSRHEPSGSADVATGRAFLYDAEGEDRRIELTEFHVDQLGDRQLLWIDVSDHDGVEELTATLGIAPETVTRLTRATKRAELNFHTDYFHVNVVVASPTGLGYEPVSLDCVAGANWVLTVHKRPIEFLERFDERIRGDSQLGRLDAPALVATFLHEHVAGFVREVEPIELELDRLDLEVMTGTVDDEAVFARLVNLRRRLSQLRRLFAQHRELYGLLARPDFEKLSLRIARSVRVAGRALGAGTADARDHPRDDRQLVRDLYDLDGTRDQQGDEAADGRVGGAPAANARRQR